MNTFGKTLGKEINASLNTKIKSIKKTNINQWQLVFDDDSISKKLLTMLFLQHLLIKQEIFIRTIFLLIKTFMNPCITLMIGFKNFHDSVYPYQKFNNDSNLDSLFYQNYKFNDNKLHCWVLQAKAQWSRDNLELSDEKITVNY